MNQQQAIFDLFNLSGRTALITGASGWLGASMASALAEAGCRVVVTSRQIDRARQVANSLANHDGLSHIALELDQMDPSSIQSSFAAALETVGRLDILVNNGLELVKQDLNDIDFEGFARHQVNNAGYFELARNMRDHAVNLGTPASIVMIGSMYGTVGSYPDTYEGLGTASSVAYHALKGATLQMTRHLAVYWAGDNVRVNCLSPGPFPNPNANPDIVERLKTKSPMNRMGQPDELKGALLLLTSDAGSYITGHNLVVDGGWTAW